LAKPAILTVDDDPAVSQAITRDLRRQYGSEYQIVRATSGAEALGVLAEFALRERPVALIASDQRMPEMTGVEFLEAARPHAPEAKLVLVTAYADTDVAIKAINDLGLDYYLLKPWDPPEEHLYPVLDDLLSAWRREHVDELGGVRVVGHRWSERSHELKTFLARNHVPYRWLDIERDAAARRLSDLADADEMDLPLVFVPDGPTLRGPTLIDLADALGLRTRAEQPLYDLCIVGGGPAGLAAAVYAASEGLQTVVVEREAPGGQAGQSAAIENYLGFPKGLSGADLTQRAVAQARRFGAEMVLARDVQRFETRGPVRAVCLGGGAEIEARAVLVATGVSYRLLDAPGLAELTGRGVFYGATASEARGCRGDDVYIVGAANSAGQAALNLARFARRVVLLVRSDELEKSMSRYLVERVRTTENIEVRLQSEAVVFDTGLPDPVTRGAVEHAPADLSPEAREHLLAQAAREVTPAIFFSLLIIAVSFLPIFGLTGQAGRLFRPLAYTKTFVMLAAAILSITVAPAHSRQGSSRLTCLRMCGRTAATSL